jgi:hypothetical protein
VAIIEKVFVAEANTPNIEGISDNDEDSLGDDKPIVKIPYKAKAPTPNFWEECVNLKEAKS